MSDADSPLTSEAEGVLRRVDELLLRLRPHADELAIQGWSEGCAAAAREALEGFAEKVRLLGSIPPTNERLNGMMRTLDWGWEVPISGALVDDLARLEYDLRKL